MPTKSAMDAARSESHTWKGVSEADVQRTSSAKPFGEAASAPASGVSTWNTSWRM